MQSNPEVFWFRSRGVVSSSTARQIVREAVAGGTAWAGPIYVLWPGAFGGQHLIGHERLYLREYEPAPGRFRTVDSTDDRAMACATLRGAVKLLSDWNRRFDTAWDIQLGEQHGSLPGDVSALEGAVCGGLAPAETAAILKRYSDRPR